MQFVGLIVKDEEKKAEQVKPAEQKKSAPKKSKTKN